MTNQVAPPAANGPALPNRDTHAGEDASSLAEWAFATATHDAMNRYSEGRPQQRDMYRNSILLALVIDMMASEVTPYAYRWAYITRMAELLQPPAAQGGESE